MVNPLIALPTLDEALTMPFGTLVTQDAGVLAALQHEALQRLGAARQALNLIDGALVFKYGQQAREARLAEGKDAGAVQLQDNGVCITVDQPKRIEWNQTLLARTVARMQAQGVDPAEFVEIHYSVDEAKYQGWSDGLKKDFEDARKVIYGLSLIHAALMPAPMEVTP